MSTRQLTSKAMKFLGELGAKAQSKEQQDILNVLFDALLFIDSTGQLYTFEDYRKYLLSDDPPRVMKAFATLEEAEAWLKEHPEPPSSAYVLVADRYHQLVYNRDLNHRRVFPHPVFEYYLGGRLQAGLPPPQASFTSRQEAEAWLENEPAPPTQAVIMIAGEPHLAVYHPNIGHRSLYPFSMAAEVEEQRGASGGPGSESSE